MKRVLSFIIAAIMVLSVIPVFAGAAENVTTEIYQLSKTDYPVNKFKNVTDKYTEDFGKLGDVTYLVVSDYENNEVEICTYDGEKNEVFKLKDITVQGIPENIVRKDESMYFCGEEEGIYIFYMSAQKYTVTKTGKKKYSDVEYCINTSDFKTFTYSEIADDNTMGMVLPENYLFVEWNDDLYVLYNIEEDAYYTSTDLKTFNKITFPKKMKSAKINIDGIYDYIIVKLHDGFLVWRTETIDLDEIIGLIMSDDSDAVLNELIEKYSYITYTSFPDIYYTTDFVTFKKTDTSLFGEPKYDADTKQGVDFLGLIDENGTGVFLVVDFVQNEINFNGDILDILNADYYKKVQTSIFFFNEETLAFEKKAVTDISYNSLYIIDDGFIVLGGQTVNGRKAFTYINGDEITNNYLINEYGYFENGYAFDGNYAVNIDEKYLYVSNDNLKTLYCFPLGENAYGNIYDIEDGVVYYDITYETADSMESYVISADIDELIDYAKAFAEECEKAGTHVKSSWIVDKESTPTEKGYRHKICKKCGKYICGEETPVTVPYMVFLDSVKNTSKGVKLSWYKSEGAQSYIIYRKSGSSSYKAIKTVSARTTSFTDTDVKSGTIYTYTVKAKNSSGKSAYDKKGLSIRFLSAPTVKTSNGKSGINVKWNKITGAKGYAIYRKTGSGSFKKIKTIKDPSVLSYTDTDVKSGKKYTYYVKAFSGSRYSGYKKSTTLLYLKAAKISSAESGKKGITVKWGKVTGAKGYYVYRKTGSGSYKKIATVKSGSTVTYLNKSAEKGKTYTYYVKAYNGSYSGTCANKVKCKDKY